MNKKENVLKKVIRLSVVAALYIALTFALSSLAYANIQFRVAEILVLLCFFRKDYAYSMILGCAIVNLFSPLGLIDVIVGTFATILSVIGVMYSKKLWIASIFPVVFNGLIVGLELWLVLDLPFIISAIEVAIGETVVMIFGTVVFKYLQKDNHFIELIDANQNIKKANKL